MVDPEARKALAVLARTIAKYALRDCPLVCMLIGIASLILCAFGYKTDYGEQYLLVTVLLIGSNMAWYGSQDKTAKEKDKPGSQQDEDPANPGRD